MPNAATNYADKCNRDPLVMLDASEADDLVADVIQHWEQESTELVMADESHIVVSGPTYEVKE